MADLIKDIIKESIKVKEAVLSGLSKEIKTVAVMISASLKKGGKMWIRIFPDKPVSKKPVEVRMGRGKGAVELWVAPVKRGRVLFEIEGVADADAREVLMICSHKLPVKSKIITREMAREVRM